MDKGNTMVGGAEGVTRHLTSDDYVKLARAMSSEIGALLRTALNDEADTVEGLACELVFDGQKGPEAKAAEFAELNTQASHVQWARKWLEDLGLAAEEGEDDGTGRDKRG